MGQDELLGFLGLFACLGSGGLLAAIVIAIVAVSRSGRLGRMEKAVEQLQRQVAGLRNELAAMRAGRASAASARATEAGAPGPAPSPVAPPAPPAPPPSPGAAPPPPATGAYEIAGPPVAPRTLSGAPRDAIRPEAAAGGAGAAGSARAAAGAASGTGGAGSGGAGGAARRPPMPPRPPSSPPPPPSAGRTPIRWEKVIGVNLISILGGGALALTGVLFFHYAIEAGLISPIMRVVLGTLVGLAAVVSSEALRSKEVPAAANALAGGGIVILYAAFWAAYVLYHLVPMEFAAALMALVTAAGCVIAVARQSRFVAILALVGGFMTPLLLTSGRDRPFGLFGYVLLLDAGFLWIAWRRRWAFLSILALAGTVILQGAWIASHMGPGKLLLGLAILGVFALVFVAAGRLAAPPEGKGRIAWIAAQAGSVLIPFAFAAYLAAFARPGDHLYPFAFLLFLLTLAAGWLGREQRSPLIPLGAAAANVAVIGVWLIAHRAGASIVWETVAVVAALAGAFHLFVEIDPPLVGPSASRRAPNSSLGSASLLDRAAPKDREAGNAPVFSALVASSGLFTVLVIFSVSRAGVAFWPFLAGWVLLALLAIRQSSNENAAPAQILAGIGLALALPLSYLVHRSDPGFPAASRIFAVYVAAGILLQAVAVVRSRRVTRNWAEYAASTFALLLLLILAVSPLPAGATPWLYPGTVLALAVLAWFSATRLGSGPLLFAATMIASFAHFAGGRAGMTAETEWPWYLVLGAATIVATAWPFLFTTRFRDDRWAFAASALAGPAWFFALKPLHLRLFGEAAVGLLPIALGALSLFAAVRARELWSRDAAIRRTVLALFSAVALGFVCVAIPLQLEKEWVTIGWALQGAAVLFLWRRLEHPGLKWFALALLAAVTVRLVANPAVLDYHPRGAFPVLNWVLYTYWIPAACLLAAAYVLRSLEVARAREWEKAFMGGQPVGAAACVLGVIAVVFVWINLAVSDYFTVGDRLTLTFAHDPARDVARSIAWAIYAVVLLVIGMVRESRMLRWISLVFLLGAAGKVTFFDLGELRDLYRVVSVFGLAVCLIAVSLFYQRFVFRPLKGKT